MNETTPVRVEAGAGLSLGHVADLNNCHPGDPITFYTRVEASAPAPGFRLEIGVPQGLTLGSARPLTPLPDPYPQVAPTGRMNYVIWNVSRNIRPGERFDFALEVQAAPSEHDAEFQSRAVLTWQPVSGNGAGEVHRAEETACVLVPAQSDYLKYLPSVYQRDELMGRYLMIFESMWDPIVKMIDNMYVYFDPRLTQAELLPWLASWIGLSLDDRWPEARRRRLVQSGLSLLRKRGTKRGLQEYLEIYTGRRPRIVEHGAHNFRLGPNARLGPAIALGKSSRPHTFTVYLTLPPVELAPGETEADRVRKEDQRRRMIVSIIESEKPAHTDYTLELEISDQ